MTGGVDDGLTFGLTLLFASIFLFALSLMMMSRAKSTLYRKSSEIRQRTKELEQACEELRARFIEREGEAKQKEAEQKAFQMEVTQLRKACAAADADSFQIVHEVGTPEPGTSRFDIEIVLSTAAMTEGGLRVDSRVWTVRNVAHVWAPDSREAVRAAGRAFPDRYGFLVTKVLNAPKQPAGGEGKS